LLKILVIQGPNLNLLGTREPGIYGATTLADIDRTLVNLGEELGARVETVQSNLEGELVEVVQRAASGSVDGILINPGAYGHTSIALRDALAGVNLPFVEVHISNIYAREPFRHKTYLSDIASGIVTGFGPLGYLLGLRGLVQMLSVSRAFKQADGAEAAQANQSKGDKK
jgi:3-dehydroquinate dehydratase II